MVNGEFVTLSVHSLDAPGVTLLVSVQTRRRCGQSLILRKRARRMHVFETIGGSPEGRNRNGETPQECSGPSPSTRAALYMELWDQFISHVLMNEMLIAVAHMPPCHLF